MIRNMIRNILLFLAVAAAFALALFLGLSRLPDAIVYHTYPDRKCLAVDIVKDNEWQRIKCSEFDWSQDYATEWGGDELELLQ